jgi:murein DD-endopeptidase MepM/ murein hydrolase activator NlpD
MRLSFALTGSGLRLRALVALLVVGVAGCSADIGRFDGDPFARSPHGDATGAVSRFGPAPELRPQADLVSDVRPSAATGRRNAPVRVAALGDQPITIPQQDAVPHAVPPKRSVATVRKKNAEPLRKHQATRRPPAPQPTRIVVSTAADAPVDTPALFDWPVHGPIVARFGAQRDGQHNSGIDIAVAQGTPIKAAEDGVVIYASDGLKWFGNLVLVRHANDYVTAYAHAKEFAVKRGDEVKRGDIIAWSGRTGQASTPRLHFEIRKDSAPVDPMPLLRRESASL